ncbi:Cytosolic carboxypeptidase [Saliniradius amylolyticus]|uniref:Cytosolic carboxypeptidase n=1 Tax=Saliniradius amylolyticus TaxID=2183582 RepID=A0A2S2DZD5_9ALTE|nr:M14 family metallopeptidase [Saliniradius amylolyticus]AWL10768.1 Cytosolic carboxypeptidase [Saliniradius amylolyticus]
MESLNNSKSRLTGLLFFFCLGVFESQAESCEANGLQVHDHFGGGAFARCSMTGDGAVKVIIRPENLPINPSPWYAMALESESKRQLTLLLEYSHSKHRYWPKFSSDFIHWYPLPTEHVHLSADQRLRADNLDVRLNHYGKSVQGRVLTGLVSDRHRPKTYIVLLGRAHPPEVTGALAMQQFVQTLLAKTALAEKFRQQFALLIYPNLNPDGVANGYWRHNAKGHDLNRDWGIFSQPEVETLWRDIERQRRDGEIAVMLDFHSTRKNIFYIQPDSLPSKYPQFAQHWHRAIQQKGAELTFDLRPGHSSKRTNAKTFFYKQLQIPAITYEVADSATPSSIASSAKLSAQAFMELLLKTHCFK